MSNLSFYRLLALCSLVLAMSRAFGAQLIWDPINNGGNPPAGANWDTTATVWYNGTADVAWTQTGTTAPLNGATFGGADGTWGVTNDAVQVAVTNLSVNNSGYTFYGPNAIYIGANNVLSVAANKTVTFNCNLAGSGTSPWWALGSGATMNVADNLASGQQLRLAGASGSAINLTGTGNAPSIAFIDAPVTLNGSLIPSSSFYIGYTQTLPFNGTSYTTGTLTINGASSVFTVNGNILIIGRATGTGTLVVNNGTATVGNTTANRNVAMNYDSSAGSSGTVNVNGGTLTVGSSSQLANRLNFFQTAGSGPATAALNQSGGQINTWGGIQFGPSASTTSHGTATLTQTGGALYIGGNGITAVSSFSAANSDSFSISLSGGTIAALANWSSSLPMTLGAASGNTTFQCADASATSWNISLSGPLTGTGGMNVTGTGTLTLSGANNYVGSTVVSNGTLLVTTSAAPTNGPVTLDGSAGSPTATVQSNPGQRWTMGTLTFQNGGTTAGFQFGALSPSMAVAPMLVAGSVAFTATPAVNITGTAIPVGTYPLIKYTGSVSGTMPTTPSVPGYISAAYVTNIAASKTIALVVTSSTYNPALYWRVGSGVWDINTTSNWTQFGSPAKYTDGNAVIFDDSATGPSPITVTLNTSVNPLSVTANNATNQYTISGLGSISGSGTLSVLGTGMLSLNGTNNYNGGTIVSAGQLNINNGGDPVSGTAIGLGPLTLNSGATIDNTSGSDQTLQPSISETWNGNFTYAGSSNNFNTGSGAVTLGNSMTLAVNSHGLTVGGGISDGGFNYSLSKTGNGTLTLAAGNSFGGGLNLYSGQLNFGDPNALGSSAFTIYGGTIDNSSGASLTLNPLVPYSWSGSFGFLGTTNLDLGFANVTIPNGLGSIVLNVVSNTLATEGVIVNNNTTVNKIGNGTWAINGSSSGSESLGMIVMEGQVNLNKSGGQAIAGGNNVGLTVRAGGLVLDQNSFQIHSDSPIPLPVSLSGGIWDLNGWTENIDQLFISNGGILRNGAPTSTSTITTVSGYTAMLSGPNCQFDVTASDAVLNFNGALGGSGSLVKTGAGLLNLNSNNTYTGNTTVNAGSLALAFPSLYGGSVVSIATNAMLQLDFAATNTIEALVLNGAGQPPGIYSAANSPAYISGPGALLVVPGNLSFRVQANTLNLSWPSNVLGWVLQTNVAGVRSSGSWFDLPGSATNTQLAVPLSTPGISSEFFRLRQPN